MTTAEGAGEDPGAADPYRYRIAAVAGNELAPDEQLLAATRLVLPMNNARYDENLEERSGLRDMALLQHLMVVVRPAPKPIAGFPLAWDMVLGLTRHRVLVWKPRRGSQQPGDYLGSVPLNQIEAFSLSTVPDRKGRTLAVKISLDHGPRIMFDVLAGFRADTEHFVEEAQHHVEVRRFLG